MPTRLFYSGPSLTVLHDQYAVNGRIDPAAQLTNSSSIVVDACVERVWEVVGDLRNWPTWGPGFELLELADIAPGASFRWKLRGARIRSTFAVVEPERELSWTGTCFGFKAVDR